MNYINPEEISSEEFILCNSPDLFLLSTHFTRVPKEFEPNCDEVYYFVRRSDLQRKLEGGQWSLKKYRKQIEEVKYLKEKYWYR